MRVRATAAALGAEVEGVDLRALDDDAFAAIHQAWLDHQVLLFRDQALTDDDLVAFSRRFGELDEAPIQETGRRFVEGHPEIYVVSNVVREGVAIGSLGSGEAVWHTDMSYLPHPPKASVLYALEVPSSGGDTSFCSMYAAWDALPDAAAPPSGRRAREARRHLQQRRLHASGRHADRRSAHVARHAPPAGLRAPGNADGAALYLGRRRNAYIEGLSLDESDALLDEIWAWATRDSLDVAAPVARRRPRAVGQPLHDAPPRRVRSRGPPRHAPHADSS